MCGVCVHVCEIKPGKSSFCTWGMGIVGLGKQAGLGAL